MGDMSQKKKEISKFVSDCCNGNVWETYTYPKIVEKHRRIYAVDLPPYQDVCICLICNNECEKIGKMVG